MDSLINLGGAKGDDNIGLTVQKPFAFKVYIFKQKSERIFMGETCSQPEMRGDPQPQLTLIKSSIPLEPLDELDQNRQMNESQFLHSRTNFVKRCNENTNNMVKSRLSQLSDLSRLKGSRFDQGQRTYIEALKGYFVGEIANGLPQGYGCIEFDSGDYIEGEFVEGRCEGRGRYIKKNGSYFEGDFKNSVADGYGKYLDKSGYKYEGQWKNNMANGKGEALYPDGSRYNGEFLNNRRQGKGVLMQHGCIFEGSFTANKFDGQGSMQSDNGERYSGGWKDNLKHGEGEYLWPNGNSYRGEYRGGKREGFGVMTYANGESYEGGWLDGLKHGEGVYRGLKKDVIGTWKKGQLSSQR